MPATNYPTLLSFVFFAEGSGAAASGDPQAANPYQRGTVQHDRWQDGWSWALSACIRVGEPDANA